MFSGPDTSQANKVTKGEKSAANPEPKKSSKAGSSNGEQTQKSSADVQLQVPSVPPEPKDEGAKAMEVDDEKAREAIKAEREAKKLAKAAAKQKQGSKSKGDAGDVAEADDVAKPAKAEKSAEPADEAGPGKSKAELKAERRAKQEAQRAAKEQQKQQAASAPAPGPIVFSILPCNYNRSI